MQVSLNLLNKQNLKLKNQPINNSTNAINSQIRQFQNNSIGFLGKDFYSALNPNFNVRNSASGISFMGHTIHILDGGSDASDMEHFARVRKGGAEIDMHKVDTEEYTEAKKLESLEYRLKILNKKDVKGQYIAIPMSAVVSICDLEKQFNKFAKKDADITPENIKVYKKELLAFLEALYTDPDSYKDLIDDMNGNRQGLQYAWGVIDQINKLVEKGAKVYVSAGQPVEETLSWLAEKEKVEPEFYYYVRTGQDPYGVIEPLIDLIKDEKYYDFNLLSLSDANIINTKDITGKKDFILTAYDSCVTDGERGVYNFTPIRKEDGELTGYSFTDDKTCEYSCFDYPNNEQLEPLNRFVGKNLQDVIAPIEAVSQVKHYIISNIPTITCPDLLYPVEKIFSDEELETSKAGLQGDYVDRTLTRFYDVNKNGEVIYPNYDYEGTGKASVRPMWGSSYSVINAIVRDIALEDSVTDEETLTEYTKKLKTLLNEGKYSNRNSNIEKQLKSIIEMDRAYAVKNPGYFMNYVPLYQLAELYCMKGRNDEAKYYYDKAINVLSKKMIEGDRTNISDLVRGKEFCRQCEQYNKEIAAYNDTPAYKRAGMPRPLKPENYEEYEKYKTYPDKLYDAMIIGDMFGRLSEIAEDELDMKTAKLYMKAANAIARCNETADMIIARRRENIKYLEDLFKE